MNRPVPNVAFPRVNETAAVQEKVGLYIAESYKRSAIKFAKRGIAFLAVLVAGLTWRLLR